MFYCCAIGIQALALLASTCISKISMYADSDFQSRFQQKLLNKIKTKGLPKNVYEVSLLIQVRKYLYYKIFKNALVWWCFAKSLLETNDHIIN